MFRTLAALRGAPDRHRHDRVRADRRRRRLLPRQDRAARHRLWRRRRLRRLWQVLRPLSRRAHPRQADRDRAEHAGRRQPQRRQLALQGRAQGRHRARRAQPGHARRPGARPARHPVRRAQLQLDRQHGGGQQHHDHLARERRAHHRRREEDDDRDRRHRRELAVGALPDRRQQPVRHAVQDRVGLSRRRRHHDRARAARGRRPRQRLLGVAQVQQPGLDQGQARSTSCSRSARAARPTCPTRRS